MLTHVLDGGTEGHFPSVLKSSLPVLVNLARAVLLHEDVVRPEGLLPSQSPDMQIYAPSYKLRNCWVLRTLTLPEGLRLHQLPLYMDPLLSSLSPHGLLPFKDSLCQQRCMKKSSIGGNQYLEYFWELGELPVYTYWWCWRLCPSWITMVCPW
jgi:hypothetical protein